MDVGHLIKNMPKKHNYTHIRAGDTVKVFYRVVEGDKNATVVISHEQTRKMHKDARIAGRRKHNEKKIPEIDTKKLVIN